MFIEELMEFGLSEKEARVYLALLELEIAIVQDIAKKADVNRSSTYVVLESLKERGLVSISEERGVQKFVAASPERLVRMVEQVAAEKLRLRHKLNDILPDLKSLQKNLKQKPRIRIFEGKENVISHLEEIFSCKEKVMRVYSSGGRLHNFLPDYMPIYMKKRAQLGIKMYGIHPDDALNDQMRKFQPSFDESIFIPPEKFKFSSDFAVYDNTVAYISHDENMSISIESHEIAEAMKSAFDLAFEGAKHLTVKNPKRKIKRK